MQYISLCSSDSWKDFYDETGKNMFCLVMGTQKKVYSLNAKGLKKRNGIATSTIGMTIFYIFIPL